MKVNFRSESATSVFDALSRYGHDEDFEGVQSEGFAPTSALPGSMEKLNVMRRRVENGQPLYHEDDCILELPPRPWELPMVCDEVVRREKGKTYDN